MFDTPIVHNGVRSIAILFIALALTAVMGTASGAATRLTKESAMSSPTDPEHARLRPCAGPGTSR